MTKSHTHGLLLTDAKTCVPVYGLRHADGEHSVTLTAPQTSIALHLLGTPAELHNVALAIIAAADQAAAVEAERQAEHDEYMARARTQAAHAAMRTSDQPASHVHDWALEELAEIDSERWTTGDDDVAHGAEAL